MSLIPIRQITEAKLDTTLADFRNVSDNLRNKGFSAFNLKQLGLGELETVELTFLFGMMTNELPIDPYGGKESNRYRRYIRFVLVPSAGELVALVSYDKAFQPISQYRQPPGHNPEFPDVARSFPSYPPRLIEGGAFAQLILTLYRLAISSGIELGNESVEVGVHIIEMRPAVDKPSVGSPNHQHTDGEPVTFGILLKKENIAGAQNYITDRSITKHWKEVKPEQIHAVFTLETPGEAWVIDDKAISHGVTEASLTNPNFPGGRIILLVDFTPLVPVKTEGSIKPQ